MEFIVKIVVEGTKDDTAARNAAMNLLENGYDTASEVADEDGMSLTYVLPQVAHAGH